MKQQELPLPPHFDAGKAGKIWKVDYQQRAAEAAEWAHEHRLSPAADDSLRVCLLLIDVQNTFCLPDFELFVAGRSGGGAVEDNQRLCRFIYQNLGRITSIIPTLDTHQAMQIFHSIFFVDEHGAHPAPFTMISQEDISSRRWRFNPALAGQLGLTAGEANEHLRHYAAQLQRSGKFALTVWPYHAMLGGIGHALVPAVEEAIFFHTVARYSQPDFQIKGQHPLTEHYSALGPEVSANAQGAPLAARNEALLQKLRDFDAIIIAGQAKSHCVAWTVADILEASRKEMPDLAQRCYLLQDCTSPVVIPGVVDYSEQADTAFSQFAAAGMHLVESTLSMREWPGVLQGVNS